MEGDSCPCPRPSEIFPIAVLCWTNVIGLKMIELDYGWGVEWNDTQNHFKERFLWSSASPLKEGAIRELGLLQNSC